MPAPAPAGRLADAWRKAVAEAASLGPLVAAPLAIGWATVDLDRATRELALALGPLGVTRFRSAPRCVALGGACRVATGVLPGGGSLVVLEPDTEGRLAASLARHDEGPVATWLVAAAEAPGVEAAVQAGLVPPGRARLAVSAESDGPFGPERLIVGAGTSTLGQSWRLIVRPAGTIPP